jgi:PAS domain S-box-containing protein
MKVRSLRHLLAIRSAWIALVPFLLSAMLGWFWLRPQMIADTEENQRQLAELIASRTEAYLVASSEAITGTASVLSKRLVSSNQVQEYLDTVLASSMNLTSITFTDANGRITAIALPSEKAPLRQEMTGIDLSLTSAVRQVRASGKPAWSDAYLSPVGGGLAVAYATPAAEGVALGEISLTQLSSFLGGIAAQGKQTVFILDRRGQVIADQEGRYTARQYNLTNLEIVREGLASGRPVTRTFSFNGDRFVGCMIRAPLLGWNILVASPVDLAYRSALTTTGIFATALCMALILAAGLSLLISHSLAKRFEKLVSHARMIESGEEAGEWPKAPVREFNLLGDALHSMANTLRERENRLNVQLLFMQQLLDSIPVPVYYKDAAGVYLGCNAAFEAFIGMPRSDVVGKTVHEVVPKERADKHHEADVALLRHPGVKTYELSGIYSDGGSRVVISNKATFVDPDNRVAGIVGAIIEITERKRTEEALLLNAERMEALLQLNQMAGATLDEITSFAFEAAVRMTRSRLGYLAFMDEEETVMTMQLWSHEAMAECKVPGDPRIYPVATTGLWGEAVRQRRPVITNDYNAANPWKKGTPEGHVSITRHMNLPVIVGGRIVLVAGVGNKEEDYNEADVNQLTLLMEGMWRLIERRRAEEKIRDSLAEKEVLLKEVHHRVKNNMQIISSLLELQSDYIPDERSRACLRESQNRIRSMALIHERLYESEDLSSIDLGEYISDLSQYLFNSYAVESERVSLNIDAGNIYIDINRAVPCGLIINELISNSLKHGFPHGRSGEIKVRVKSDGGRITLQVADTGIGMPAGLDFKNTETLGLQLVNLLARQLRGSISFDGGEKGTVAIISFQGTEAVGEKTEGMQKSAHLAI